MSKRIAILGATGYAGETATEILLRHPDCELVHLGSDRLAGQTYSQAVPAFAGRCDLLLQADTTETLLAAKPDAVILAKKSPDVTKLVPDLLAAGVKLIDIGTEFRLKSIDAYNTWYKGPHDCPEMLDQAVYGLSEWHRDAISEAQLVGNPGCYATSMLLPLLPLLRDGLVNLTAPIVNTAYSGISGAGKRFIEGNNNLFWATNENLHAYKALAHQHQAEVDQELSGAAQAPTHIHFIPHLAPITRGILSTINCCLNEGVSLSQIHDSWENAYAEAPFVRLRTDTKAVEVANVAGTNFSDFAGEVDGQCLVITSAIDNLVKGASGQAVQNLNLMFDFKETAGLL